MTSRHLASAYASLSVSGVTPHPFPSCTALAARYSWKVRCAKPKISGRRSRINPVRKRMCSNNSTPSFAPKVLPNMFLTRSASYSALSSRCSILLALGRLGVFHQGQRPTVSPVAGPSGAGGLRHIACKARLDLQVVFLFQNS